MGTTIRIGTYTGQEGVTVSDSWAPQPFIHGREGDRVGDCCDVTSSLDPSSSGAEFNAPDVG